MKFKSVVQTNLVEEDTPENLYIKLKDAVVAKTSYEYNNTVEEPYMKIYGDYDLENINIEDSVLMTQTESVLKALIGDEIKVIWTTDHRKVRKMKKGKLVKTPIKKKSFHFIVWNRFMLVTEMRDLFKDKMNEFPMELDMKVYRKGDSLFRLPYTIKEKNLEKRMGLTRMKIVGDDNIENFTRCCITEFENAEFFSYEKEEKEVKKEKKEFNKDRLFEHKKLDNKQLEVILHQYGKSINECKVCEDNPYRLFVNVDVECPWNNHDKNNRFLSMNFLTNEICLTCHSEKCLFRKEVIASAVFSELVEFSIPTFERLEEYKYMKEYLEKRVLYLTDINEFKQIKYLSPKEKYTVNIAPIEKKPIMDCKTYIASDGEEEIKKIPFEKIYNNDKYKNNIYKNTWFNPCDDVTDDNYFNEFMGLNYKKCLGVIVDDKKILQEQQENIYLMNEYILEFICGGEQNVYNYLKVVLSAWIKYPGFINAVVPMLYSIEEGSGKTSFWERFIFKIIGEVYCRTAKLSLIVSDHSNLQHKTLLVLMDDIDYETFEKNSGILRNIVQSNKSTLNEKFKPMEAILTYTHYAGTLNTKINIPNGNRRYLLSAVKKIEDKDEYLHKITSLYESDEFIYAYGIHLERMREEFNYREVNLWWNKMPKTKISAMMTRKDYVDRFFELLATGLFLEEYDQGDIMCAFLYREATQKFRGTFIIKRDSLFRVYEELMGERKMNKDNFFSKGEQKKYVEQHKLLYGGKQSAYMVINFDKIVKVLNIGEKYRFHLFWTEYKNDNLTRAKIDEIMAIGEEEEEESDEVRE